MTPCAPCTLSDGTRAQFIRVLALTGERKALVVLRDGAGQRVVAVADIKEWPRGREQ